MSDMRRRQFITLLGGAAASWPLAVRAQQPAMPVIGYLGSESLDLYAERVRAFRQGLSETGYVEDRNMAIDYRWGEGQNDRLAALAADLVQRRVDVIATAGSPAALAAKAATAKIPIVFQTGGDPVEIGLVASLNRPGGNVTGVTSLNVEVGSKRLELLHEVIPTARIVALLVNPTNPTNTGTISKDLQAAARTLGLQIDIVHASSDPEIATVFATLVQRQAGGLVIGADPFFNSRSGLLAALTIRHALPAIYAYREFVAAGGLMSYAGSYTDSHRQAGVYTGRILKGDKPADLPVQRSTKVEFFINLKTAKALGIDVPTSILLRADEVIE